MEAGVGPYGQLNCYGICARRLKTRILKESQIRRQRTAAAPSNAGRDNTIANALSHYAIHVPGGEPSPNCFLRGIVMGPRLSAPE